MMQHQAGFCCRVVGANRPGKAGAWRSAGPSGKVVLKPITLGRDFGDTVEVLMVPRFDGHGGYAASLSACSGVL